MFLEVYEPLQLEQYQFSSPFGFDVSLTHSLTHDEIPTNGLLCARQGAENGRASRFKTRDYFSLG